MLTIRLQRHGKKNQPFFKIVVTEEKKSSTGGRFVEEVGFYNPLTKEKSLKGDRVKYWVSVGAKPSDTVHNMLVAEKIVEGTKRPQHKKSKKQAGAEAAPASQPEVPAAEAKQEVEPHSAEDGSTSAQIDEQPAEPAKPEQTPKEQEQAPEPTSEEPKPTP